MAPKEDDITRLKNLLASGLSITEAAKRMDVSRSTAQRLKKKIVEISDSKGDTEVVWGRLSANAVTLQLASGKMHEMLDWSKPIYWNDESIFQKYEDYWLSYPLGTRLQEWHGVDSIRVRAISTKFLSDVLMLSGLGTKNHYLSVTNNLQPWLEKKFYRTVKDLLKSSYNYMRDQGDLSTRHLQGYPGPNLELILDSISRHCEDLIDEAPFIHLALLAGLGEEREKGLEILQAKGIEIESYSKQWISMATFGGTIVSPDEFLTPLTQDSYGGVHDVGYPSCVLFFGIKNILQVYTELPEEVIDYMIQHDNYESTDVELVIFGGIDEVDLEFAKKGQFRNIGELNLAREKNCTNSAELELVVEHGWASGDELRKAQDHYGLGPDGRQLYLNMAELNPQVNWTGEWKHDLLEWADLADEEDFQRLRGFPDPKSMVFFEDVLMQIDEDSVRTDFLIRDFNEIDAPGSFISDEAEFGELLSMPCFRGIVKVGKLGVSTINLDDSSAEIKKKIQQFYAINEELYNEIALDERVPGDKFVPPIDYLSEYLQNIIFEDEATNFVKNSDERFHRWWPYLEGFSAEFVREVFSELEIGPEHVVLDPFSGSGTTNLTCKLAGIQSVGIEINPTMHSILESKLNWNIDLGLFKQAMDDFEIPAKITQTPPSFLDNERQFNPGILQNLLGIKQYIKTITNESIQQLFYTAFGSILLDCSNLKRSPSVGYTEKNYLYDEYPIEKFRVKIGHVYEDLCSIENSQNKDIPANVHLGNSGDKILDPIIVDFTITSPPYLNFFDYPGNYKIEMGWLEHVSSTKDLKRIKDEMVPCDNISRGLVREYMDKERIFSHKWLDYIETTVQANTDVRPKIRRKDFPGIIKKYFDDMALIIDHVAHATKKGGMFLLVVGDSLLTDVYVPTDILLIKIAEEYGFELETLKITRSRRSGIRRSFRLRETVAYLRKK